MRLSLIVAFQKRTIRKAWLAVAVALAFFYGLDELQAQPAKTWLWANSGTGAEVASSCSAPAIDPSGNAYVIGSFRSNGDALTFSNSPASLSNFNPGVFTIFMAKYHKDGSLLWAKSFKSGTTDGALIGVDASGNIYCTGVYRDSICIDNITLNGSSSQYIQFLAKFTTTGNLLWARNITSAAPGYYLQYSALEVDAKNNVLMAGNFNQGTVLFDSIPINNSDHSATGYDYFVARFDEAGNPVWASSGGTPDQDDFANSLCINPQGGFYTGTMYQDSGVVINGGQIRIYKYDPMDSVAWNEPINATSGALLGAMTCDRKGDLYLTGTYSDVIALDNLTLNEAGGGCFVAKYNQLGDAIWARSSRSNATDVTVFTTGIGVDPAGTVSIGGSYVYSLLTPVSTVTFDTITLTLQGNRDAFLAQYNSDGSVLNAVNISGIYSDFGSGLKVSGNGTLYYTGSFYSPAVALDSVTLTNTPNSTSSYYGKFFIAQYGAGTGTGISKIADPSWLHLYPNPAQGAFTVTAAAPIKAIRITDQLGREIYYEALPNGTRQQELNIGAQARGVYYVHVSTSGGYAVKALTLN